jgi:hypothetical protein
MVQPLKPGEHLDMDSGVRVERLENGEQYRLIHHDFGHVVLTGNDIEEIAELVE